MKAGSGSDAVVPRMHNGIMATADVYGACEEVVSAGTASSVQAPSAHNLRPLLGPCSARFERLRRFCIVRKAGCGLRRIAALTGLERIADCTAGPLQCKDASLSSL
eukprot:5959920-Alexandrium_andersonii.AAC.1